MSFEDEFDIKHSILSYIKADLSQWHSAVLCLQNSGKQSVFSLWLDYENKMLFNY